MKREEEEEEEEEEEKKEEEEEEIISYLRSNKTLFNILAIRESLERIAFSMSGILITS